MDQGVEALEGGGVKRPSEARLEMLPSYRQTKEIKAELTPFHKVANSDLPRVDLVGSVAVGALEGAVRRTENAHVPGPPGKVHPNLSALLKIMER